MGDPARRFPFFGVPPARTPVPVEDVPAVRGKRVILSTPEGFIYDVRAASEVLRDEKGAFVWVVSEVAWYRWMLTSQEPTFKRYSTRLVFVE